MPRMSIWHGQCQFAVVNGKPEPGARFSDVESIGSLLKLAIRQTWCRATQTWCPYSAILRRQGYGGQEATKGRRGSVTSCSRPSTGLRTPSRPFGLFPAEKRSQLRSWHQQFAPSRHRHRSYEGQGGFSVRKRAKTGLRRVGVGLKFGSYQKWRLAKAWPEPFLRYRSNAEAFSLSAK